MTRPEVDRIASLDLVRGVAVMGIVSVNIIDFAMVRAAYFNPAAFGGQTGVDLFVWGANLLLVDGKMRALFSMLFGASMLLVIDRADAAGERSTVVHARRMLVLLAFGLLHYVLLWSGDILHVYAVAGLLGFGTRHYSVRGLIVRSAVLLTVSMAMFGAYALHLHELHQAAMASGATNGAVAEWRAATHDLIANGAVRARAEAIQAGPWSGGFLDRLYDLPGLWADILIILPETIGLMLAGMAAFRSVVPEVVVGLGLVTEGPVLVLVLAFFACC